MNPRVFKVVPKSGYKLALTFSNAEQGICPDTLYIEAVKDTEPAATD